MNNNPIYLCKRYGFKEETQSLVTLFKIFFSPFFNIHHLGMAKRVSQGGFSGLCLSVVVLEDHDLL